MEGSWEALGGLMGRLRSLLRLLEGSWVALERLLGGSWGALGPSKGPLEGLGRLLGGSWGALGPSCGSRSMHDIFKIFPRGAMIDFYEKMLQKHWFS